MGVSLNVQINEESKYLRSVQEYDSFFYLFIYLFILYLNSQRLSYRFIVHCLPLGETQKVFRWDNPYNEDQERNITIFSVVLHIKIYLLK